jgi:hypothetical protein
MAFKTGSGWKPFTNGQVFPRPSGSPPTPPPGWEIITDTLNPVITFTVATSYSPYTWDANWESSFGFDTMAPTTPGVYTFTIYSIRYRGWVPRPNWKRRVRRTENMATRRAV